MQLIILMQYADNSVLMSETIKRLRNKFWKWMKAFKGKGLNVNFRKTKVTVSRCIAKDWLFMCKVYLCCDLRLEDRI